MRAAYDVETVRAAEQRLMNRLPDGTLMQRAAAGLAATSATLLGGVYGSRVVVLAGSGDNGGDALYAGARLANRGASVDALLLSPKRTHQGGLAALRYGGGRIREAAESAPSTLDVLDDADLVLDGIVGIGGKGGLRPPAAAAAARAEASDAVLVAVDVPSGVDASTGVVEGAAVRADVTVTFGAVKAGLLVDPGASHAGIVELVDIGLGPELPAAEITALQGPDIRALLPAPSAESDKYRRGVLGVVAGSRSYTGAAVLATGGALRCGVGMVRFVADAHPAEIVRQRWAEAVITEIDRGAKDPLADVGRVQAWAAGPGMGTDEGAARLLAAVLATDVPAVVDADGLTLVSQDRGLLADRTAPTLLTPHAGELARLLDGDPADVGARRLEHCRRAADELGVTVLLKGSTTVVAEPGGGAVRVNGTGTPWLATAGSGDVLTGACGALLSAGLGALDAGSVGAFLHGLAARIAADGAAVIAYDVLEALPAAVRALDPTGLNVLGQLEA